MRSFSSAHWPTRPSPSWKTFETLFRSLIGVAGEQLQQRLIAILRIVDIEDALLRVDQRRQLGEHQLADGEQVALALHHAGEPRDVGLQPVLLGVLAGGFLEVDDHLVDRVLQGRHFALRVDSDGSRQVALGHGGRHFRHGADLGRQVRGELVHVVGQIAPDAGRAGHSRLAAELSFDTDLARHAWSPGRRTRPACRSCR